MKKTALFLALLVCVTLVGQTAAQGSKPAQKKGARDLYIEGPGGNSGMSGAKVSIELNRNGRTSYVAPNYAFQSGDRIRLVFDLNFQGYVTVLNLGSSGRISMLYPYRGVGNRVYPNAATKLPANGDWIKFDNRPGTEQLTIIFSANPIPEVQQYESLVAQETPSGGTPGNGGTGSGTPGNGGTGSGNGAGGGGVSTGGPASSSEAQQILEELNSRSLRRGNKAKGRDLYIESANDGDYCVANGSQITEPIAFTISLTHN